MTLAHSQFERNMAFVRGFTQLHNATPRGLRGVDREDISRSQIVMLVSSLDQYVHEIVRFGMLEIFFGRRIETKSFRKFSLTTEVLRQALASPTSSAWLDNHIRTAHSVKSFQKSEKIAEAFRLIVDLNLWDAVAKGMEMSHDDVTRELDLIVNRRNQIAHEADLDPSYPGKRYGISRQDVQRAIRHIVSIARNLDELTNLGQIKPIS
jgi:hypothetical protein